MIDPVANRFSGLLGDLELNGQPRLLLHHHSPPGNRRTVGDVSNSNLDQVTASEFAVEGEIK
jgi:hypothetical protein